MKIDAYVFGRWTGDDGDLPDAGIALSFDGRTAKVAVQDVRDRRWWDWRWKPVWTKYDRRGFDGIEGLTVTVSQKMAELYSALVKAGEELVAEKRRWGCWSDAPDGAWKFVRDRMYAAEDKVDAAEKAVKAQLREELLVDGSELLAAIAAAPDIVARNVAKAWAK